MHGTIDSRADFRDVAPKPKTTINQETEISDNVLAIQRNIISPKNNKGSGISGDEFDTKITCDLAGLTSDRWLQDQNDSSTNKFAGHQHKNEISNEVQSDRQLTNICYCLSGVKCYIEAKQRRSLEEKQKLL
jgi:hypothetical protein